MKDFALKDSGERQQFSTGSVRDAREGKGRFDLIPWRIIRRLALVFERGASKYGDRNWEKGQPLSRYFDSAIRHAIQWHNGEDDEDHIAQAIWNLVAAAETEERVWEGTLPPDLVDCGSLYRSNTAPEGETEYSLRYLVERKIHDLIGEAQKRGVNIDVWAVDWSSSSKDVKLTLYDNDIPGLFHSVEYTIDEIVYRDIPGLLGRMGVNIG